MKKKINTRDKLLATWKIGEEGNHKATNLRKARRTSSNIEKRYFENIGGNYLHLFKRILKQGY